MLVRCPKCKQRRFDTWCGSCERRTCGYEAPRAGPFWEGERVRVAATDDDWPNRAGIVSQSPYNPEWLMVSFEDGEGGEYPPEMLQSAQG